jgi:hypothetical protein
MACECENDLLYAGQVIQAAGAMAVISFSNAPPYRTWRFGYSICGGWKTNVVLWFHASSYELKEILFIELNCFSKKQDTKTTPITSKNTTAVSIGCKMEYAQKGA